MIQTFAKIFFKTDLNIYQYFKIYKNQFKNEKIFEFVKICKLRFSTNIREGQL